ncbi:DUF5682 family protein [Hymenobacter glacieicola]|uniref:PD-(D/E)XK endonuclease-like domain-containing protein n=1 Tax=Hymenobacter glacieicola TaxID=1562124 RepID=A0ABQ1WY77_9BACT|nr:DUF5682 family protein [Hymenobacter glacieicola]GGG49916.1 hypothetical protein GCM10011378_27500 [Hymenobacter glacieicola]
MPTDLHLYGIRHHGPGSTASLLKALDEFRPDMVLLECPADGEKALALAANPELKPPVALLIYNPKQHAQATFLPFAYFSPEWQATLWCQQHGAHLRCFDLPMTLRFANEDVTRNREELLEPSFPASSNQPNPENDAAEIAADNSSLLSTNSSLETDPIAHLARLDGYTDGERWWEARMEHSAGHADTFGVVLQMMTALREELAQPESGETLLREAYMRETLRATLKQGYQRVAVVCGAWHAPVLRAEQLTGYAKDDKARLKGLKKVPTEATWVPWTYERLARQSGYGAGVLSPAWYELLFQEPHERVVTHWMVRAAHLLRAQQIDASSAHAIEGVRLAEALAAVRGLSLPGIEELEEAAVSIFGGGYAEALELVHQQLVIGEKLGEVPAELPASPLQQDLALQQKTWRLKPEAAAKTLALDLRKDLDLGRSHLLHRLQLLGIRWGKPQRVQGKSGTFHEVWELQWRPEMVLGVLEAGRWGNTVLAAASGAAGHRAQQAADLGQISALLEEALRADLAPALPALVSRLETLSAGTRDVAHLLTALPPLINVLRYGNVRRTETAQVAQVVHHLVPRLCISLPLACTGLDRDAASQLLERLEAAHQAIRLLPQGPTQQTDWDAALHLIARQPASSGLLAGAATRLLFDAQQLAADDTATLLGLALAPAQPTDYATAWIEGFLRGSGLLLIHNRMLFDLLDAWLSGLEEAVFQETVPLLRRSFADFSQPERQQVLALAKGGPAATAAPEAEVDLERGLRVLPVLRELLGV